MEREQRSQGVREVNKEKIKSASAINQDASQEEKKGGEKKNPLPTPLQVPNKSPFIIAACIWLHYLSVFVNRWSRLRKDKHQREQQRADEANAG